MNDSREQLILIIDDDAESRETLGDLLSTQGYAIAHTDNGRQALDYLSHSTPALILLDLMMPVMSGWEFRAQQKSNPRLKFLPVVAMTASGLVGDIDADAIVHKPIDFDKLMTVVKQNCS
jgi:CheY-like chemotaxis protein